MSNEKSAPDPLADLAAAIRELRDNEVVGELKALREEIERLRAEKAAPAPSCCGHHHCGTVYWYWPGYPGHTYPYTVTYTQPTVTTIGAGTTGWTSSAASLPGGSYTVTS